MSNDPRQPVGASATAPQTSPAGPDAPVPPFVSARRRSKAAIIASRLVAVLAGVAILAHAFELNLITAGESAIHSLFDLNLQLQIVVLVVLGAVQLFWFIAMLVWVYRAHKNLRSLGAVRLRYTPNIAVGCWIVPLANFFMPFEALREIWQCSDPENMFEQAQYWAKTKTAGILRLWWASFLTWYLLDGACWAIRGGAKTIESLVAADIGHIMADAARISFVLLTAAIIRRIDAMQDEKIRLLTLDGATAKTTE